MVKSLTSLSKYCCCNRYEPTSDMLRLRTMALGDINHVISELDPLCEKLPKEHPLRDTYTRMYSYLVQMNVSRETDDKCYKHIYNITLESISEAKTEKSQEIVPILANLMTLEAMLWRFAPIFVEEIVYAKRKQAFGF